MSKRVQKVIKEDLKKESISELEKHESSENNIPLIRPHFEQIYMKLAFDLAQRSTCQRKLVGCVITTTDFRKVLAVGYNGNAAGLSNGCDHPNVSGACGCLHAEDNCVVNCDSPRFLEKIVFVTAIPCIMCSKRLINLGNVKKVYYSEQYRDISGLDLLQSVGIEIENLIL